mgnify:CR=1 FL=1
MIAHAPFGGQRSDGIENRVECRYLSIVAAYRRWLDSHPSDFNGSISSALRGHSPGWSECWKLSRISSALRWHSSKGSQANGALMRICPLAVFGAGYVSIAALSDARRTDTPWTEVVSPVVV